MQSSYPTAALLAAVAYTQWDKRPHLAAFLVATALNWALFQYVTDKAAAAGGRLGFVPDPGRT